MKNIFTGKNIVLLLALGLYMVYNNYYLPSQQNQAQESPKQEVVLSPSNEGKTVKIERKNKGNAAGAATNANRSKAPSYVYDVWDYVVAHGEAMPNYVGGRTFQNREKRLPKTDNSGKTLKYQEWDVHKKVNGKNRGAERLVTGSNKSAYYTKDHYKSFVRLDE